MRRPTTTPCNLSDDQQLPCALAARDWRALTQDESFDAALTRGNTSREALFPFLFPLRNITLSV